MCIYYKMPSNTPEFIRANRLRLNQRAKLSYYNSKLRMDYAAIHEFETAHGLQDTIVWMKRLAFDLKYGEKE